MQRPNKEAVNALLEEARAWEALDRHKKAIESYNKALAILEGETGEEALLWRGECYQELGTLWRLLGKHAKTGGFYLKALADYQAVFGGQTHIKLGEIYYLLGSFMEQLWKKDLANEYYTQALAQLRGCLGESHPHTQTLVQKIWK